MRQAPLTVPSTVATMATHAGVCRAEDLAGFGRQFGQRTEMDMTKLTKVHPEVAQWSLQYWQRTCHLWNVLQSGRGGVQVLAGSVVLERDLVTATQTDSQKNGRQDLRAELEALERFTALRPVLDALLSRDLEEDELVRAAAGLRHQLTRDGKRSVLTLRITDPYPWPDELGGPRCPGELVRVITLTAQHAAWRDRKVRRLVEVKVSSEELWVDPLVAAAA
jgi:hypothetical protein